MPLNPPPDVVIGNNGTSHHSKLEALSVALPSSLQFVSLSDNCRTCVLSQLTFIGRKTRCHRTTWIIRKQRLKRENKSPATIQAKGGGNKDTSMSPSQTSRLTDWRVEAVCPLSPLSVRQTMGLLLLSCISESRCSVVRLSSEAADHSATNSHHKRKITEKKNCQVYKTSSVMLK